MTFTVTYKPSAEAELADVWLRAADRQAIADAANRIDALLHTNPHQQGESFSSSGPSPYCSKSTMRIGSLKCSKSGGSVLESCRPDQALLPLVPAYASFQMAGVPISRLLPAGSRK
jgi:hypothetical protein